MRGPFSEWRIQRSMKFTASKKYNSYFRLKQHILVEIPCLFSLDFCPSKQQEGHAALRESGTSLYTKEVKGRPFFPSATKPASVKPKQRGRPSEVNGAPDRKPQGHSLSSRSRRGSGSGDSPQHTANLNKDHSPRDRRGLRSLWQLRPRKTINSFFLAVPANWRSYK